MCPREPAGGEPAAGEAAEVVQRLQRKLLSPDTPLPHKYRVLFALRALPHAQAGHALAQGLQDPSALLRHEIAYCLGQRQDSKAIDVLVRLLDDACEHPMVRHEAGEALGAIGTPACQDHLLRFSRDPCAEVAETCQLALQRIAHFASTSGSSTAGSSPYLSVDPAPPAPRSTPADQLRTELLDSRLPIFERYRALFGLRDRGGPQALDALGTALRAPGMQDALLKHEVAYVLGQMQDPAAVAMLRCTLEDAQEAAMVRHEAAEALGSIADDASLQLLQDYLADPEPIVADSCAVALDMAAHERSGKFQYADVAT